MKYILDLVIIVFIIGCIFAGSRKGAVMMLITLAGYVVAALTATFVSNSASEYVYDHVIKSAVVSVLETEAENLSKEYLSPQKLGEIFAENGVNLTDEQLKTIFADSEKYKDIISDDELTEGLNSIFTEYCTALTEKLSGILPEEIITEAERYLNETNMENERLINLMTVDSKSFVEIIEREIIRPAMIKTVKFVLFAVTFAVIILIVGIICRMAKVIREIPVVRSADSFLGVLLGTLQGLLYSGVFVLAVNVFIKITVDKNEYLSTAIISETYIFRFLYNAVFYLIALFLN